MIYSKCILLEILGSYQRRRVNQLFVLSGNNEVVD